VTKAFKTGAIIATSPIAESRITNKWCFKAFEEFSELGNGVTV
jgi:hypothetical protein